MGSYWDVVSIWHDIESQIKNSVTDSDLKQLAQSLTDAIYNDEETGIEENTADFLYKIFKHESHYNTLLKHGRDKATNTMLLGRWHNLRCFYMADMDLKFDEHFICAPKANDEETIKYIISVFYKAYSGRQATDEEINNVLSDVLNNGCGPTFAPCNGINEIQDDKGSVSKPQQVDLKSIDFNSNPKTDSDKANKAVLRLLERLKKDGWITLQGNYFKWRKGTTNVLVAYWVYEVSHNLRLSNKQAVNDRTQLATNWKPFENLFTLYDKEKPIKAEALKDAKAYFLRTNPNDAPFRPKGYEELEPYTNDDGSGQ